MSTRIRLVPRKSHLERVLQPRAPRLLLIEMKTIFTPALDVVLFLPRLASVPCPLALENLAVLDWAIFPTRHLTNLRRQCMSTALGHQNTVLRHQHTVLRHQNTVLHHLPTILRHQATVLRHQATVLRHQGTILPHYATVPRHQPTVLRHLTTLFHPAFLQLVAIHFGRFWKVRGWIFVY